MDATVSIPVPGDEGYIEPSGLDLTDLELSNVEEAVSMACSYTTFSFSLTLQSELSEEELSELEGEDACNAGVGHADTYIVIYQMKNTHISKSHPSYNPNASVFSQPCDKGLTSGLLWYRLLVSQVWTLTLQTKHHLLQPHSQWQLDPCHRNHPCWSPRLPTLSIHYVIILTKTLSSNAPRTVTNESGDEGDVDFHSMDVMAAKRLIALEERKVRRRQAAMLRRRRLGDFSAPCAGARRKCSG